MHPFSYDLGTAAARAASAQWEGGSKLPSAPLGESAGRVGAVSAEGGRPARLLHYLATILVDHPEDVLVSATTLDDGGVQLRLTVRRDDIGKVIGKQGRTARAIRNLVQAAAALHGERVQVQVIDD